MRHRARFFCYPMVVGNMMNLSNLEEADFVCLLEMESHLIAEEMWRNGFRQSCRGDINER